MSKVDRILLVLAFVLLTLSTLYTTNHFDNRIEEVKTFECQLATAQFGLMSVQAEIMADGSNASKVNEEILVGAIKELKATCPVEMGDN